MENLDYNAPIFNGIVAFKNNKEDATEHHRKYYQN